MVGNDRCLFSTVRQSRPSSCAAPAPRSEASRYRAYRPIRGRVSRARARPVQDPFDSVHYLDTEVSCGQEAAPLCRKMDRSSLLCGLAVVFTVSQLPLATSLENNVANDMNSTDHGAMNEPSHDEDKCVKHEEPFRSDVHIAKVEFERVQTLIIVTIFIMVVVLAKLGELIKLCI